MQDNYVNMHNDYFNIQLILNKKKEKKKGIILVVEPFSILVGSGYIGYEILLAAIYSTSG